MGRESLRSIALGDGRTEQHQAPYARGGGAALAPHEPGKRDHPTQAVAQQMHARGINGIEMPVQALAVLRKIATHGPVTHRVGTQSGTRQGTLQGVHYQAVHPQAVQQQHRLPHHSIRMVPLTLTVMVLMPPSNWGGVASAADRKSTRLNSSHT